MDGQLIYDPIEMTSCNICSLDVACSMYTEENQHTASLSNLGRGDHVEYMMTFDLLKQDAKCIQKLLAFTSYQQASTLYHADPFLLLGDPLTPIY